MTPEQVRSATGCTVHVSEVYAPFLTEACESWGIDTPLRQAAFLAQAAFESAWFTRMEEDLNYKSAIRICNIWPRRFGMPLANDVGNKILVDGRRNASFYKFNPEQLAIAVYGGRMGNAAEPSTDGWDYRGRGIAMLTGRTNYAGYAAASGMPALDHPGVVCTPPCACDSFGWFWKTNDLNRFADARDDVGLTKAINGGLTGYELEDDRPLSDRAELLAQARQILC